MPPPPSLSAARIPQSAFRIPPFPPPDPNRISGPLRAPLSPISALESPAAPSLRSPFNLSTRQPFNRVSSGNAGFTLIELIVVILIIATLAALLMTGISSAFDHAKNAQAKNDASQIVTAVNAYYTEYGKYPMVDAKQGTDYMYAKSGNSGNEDVFNALRAIAVGANAANVLNPRQIVFYSGKDSTAPRSAFATTAITGANGVALGVGAFVDPWGSGYMVSVDGGYDGATTDALPYTDLTYATGNTVRTGCFAVSFGKDHLQGTSGNKKYSGSDDVLSWQ